MHKPLSKLFQIIQRSKFKDYQFFYQVIVKTNQIKYQNGYY
jgi:hypothetical protein